MAMNGDRGDGRSGKRDRVARLGRVAAILRAHPEGIRPADIARQIGMTPRTVYRDLRALEEEIGVATWSDAGRWGALDEVFLPPFRLTLDEAMAVVLSARLMVRYADKYDPDLGSAFGKLANDLPEPLRAHVARTIDVLADHPRDTAFERRVHDLTRAWAERRIVELEYEPAAYTPGTTARRAVVRPYLVEPSLQTHALYLIGWDETRGGLRTFKIERIRDVALTPRTFDEPEPGIVADLQRAWDIIADQTPTEVILRFSPSVAARVSETRWHPTQRLESDIDGALRFCVTVTGTIEIKLWILQWGADVEVLAPAELRTDVAQAHRAAAARYDG